MHIAANSRHTGHVMHSYTYSVLLQAESTFRSELEPAGITVVSRTFKTTEDPVEAVNDLFVSHASVHMHCLWLACIATVTMITYTIEIAVVCCCNTSKHASLWI